MGYRREIIGPGLREDGQSASSGILPCFDRHRQSDFWASYTPQAHDAWRRILLRSRALLPRILLRTHYQADEPRLIIATVIHCTSPTASATEDRIADKLERWARANGYVISTPGAVYAVGNARHLGILNKSNGWSASGLALGFLNRLMAAAEGIESKILTPMEERYYLKLYLIGAGALPITFARWLLDRGSIIDAQLRTGAVLKELMISVLDQYLNLTSDLRERTAIRQERDRIRKMNYSPITSRHKRYPLLTTLERLRLLHRTKEGEDNLVIQPDAGGRLAALSRAIPDIETLERLIRHDKLQEMLDVEMHEYERHDLPTDVPPPQRLVSGYHFALNVGLQACPLGFLDDIFGAIYPTSPTTKTPKAESLLDPLHKAGEVRFHVNRKGERNYVLLTKGAIERLERMKFDQENRGD